MASAAYSDAKVGRRSCKLCFALASVRRFARALRLTVSLVVSLAVPLAFTLGGGAVSVAENQAADSWLYRQPEVNWPYNQAGRLLYAPDNKSRQFDPGVRVHVQLQMLHVGAASKWLNQLYFDSKRPAAAAAESAQEELNLFPHVVDDPIVDDFALSQDATLQYHDVSGVNNEHSLLPPDYAPGRPDRSHSFGLETSAPDRAEPRMPRVEPEFDVVPHLRPDDIAGKPNKELGTRPSKETGVGASIDVVSAQSIRSHREAASEPSSSPDVLFGVRSGGESESHLEQGVTVGNRGALTDDAWVGLTGPDRSGLDSLIGRGRTETTSLDEKLAVLAEKPSNVNEVRTLYGGIYGPVSFRERHLHAVRQRDRKAYHQAQALAEERRMSHYLHSTIGLMGTQAAISSYLRPATGTQPPVITQENFFDFLHSDAPSLLARRGRHYFDLTAPDGKDAQGDEVSTFAREQGTFIQYSFMYLKARYGERNRGLFIEGTPRALTSSEED